MCCIPENVALFYHYLDEIFLDDTLGEVCILFCSVSRVKSAHNGPCSFWWIVRKALPDIFNELENFETNILEILELMSSWAFFSLRSLCF